MTATTVTPTAEADALARDLHADFDTCGPLTRHQYRLEALQILLINRKAAPP
jgi:hypothetical protein